MASSREPEPKPPVVATNPGMRPDKKISKIWQSGSSPEAKATSFVTPQIRKKVGSPDASLITPLAPKKRARKSTPILGDVGVEETFSLPVWPSQVRQQKTADPVMVANKASGVIEDFVFGRVEVMAAAAEPGVASESVATSQVIVENEGSPSQTSDEWSEQRAES